MALLLEQQGFKPAADLLQLLFRGAPVLAQTLHTRMQLRLQGGHPHHEELIEVVAEDGAEFRLLQQRCAWVERLSQHSFVESDPAELTVDHELTGLAGLAHGGAGFCLHR